MGGSTSTDPIHHLIVYVPNFTIIGLVVNQVPSFQEWYTEGGTAPTHVPIFLKVLVRLVQSFSRL